MGLHGGIIFLIVVLSVVVGLGFLVSLSNTGASKRLGARLNARLPPRWQLEPVEPNLMRTAIPVPSHIASARAAANAAAMQRTMESYDAFKSGGGY